MLGPCILMLALSTDSTPPASELVVHEWGTFTTVVDPSGREVPWNAFEATEALPPFVHAPADSLKKSRWARVRMETPVIYFHTDRELEIDVAVGFRGGRFSEWYPFATSPRDEADSRSTTDGPRTLRWTGLKISPEHDDVLPTTLEGAHYFAARGVAAAPVRAPLGDHGWEAEKFLFYRGVGDFVTPLQARLEGEVVHVQNRSDWRIDRVLLFRRVGDRFHQEIRGELAAGGSHDFDLGGIEGAEGLSLDGLKVVLREQGLREDEAQAMVDTWRHDWFGPGLRVLYTVPRPVTDEVLPLQLSVEPTQLERVLVGRVELITPELHEAVSAAATSAATSENPGELHHSLVARHGRSAFIALSTLLDRQRHPLLAPGAWRLIARSQSP